MKNKQPLFNVGDKFNYHNCELKIYHRRWSSLHKDWVYKAKIKEDTGYSKIEATEGFFTHFEEEG